jgi:hypothetical protein
MSENDSIYQKIQKNSESIAALFLELQRFIQQKVTKNAAEFKGHSEQL